MQKLKNDLFSETLPETFIPQNDAQQSTLYNHNIRPFVNGDIDGFLYDCLICQYPLTRQNLLTQMMEEKYGYNVELKLQNEYFAAVEQLDETASKQPYLNFLMARKEIRSQVYNDCQNNNVDERL